VALRRRLRSGLPVRSLAVNALLNPHTVPKGASGRTPRGQRVRQRHHQRPVDNGIPFGPFGGPPSARSMTVCDQRSASAISPV
jgi:hypothetical protein